MGIRNPSIITVLQLFLSFVLLGLEIPGISAFVAPLKSNGNGIYTSNAWRQQTSTTLQLSSQQIPLINDWEVRSNGVIVGIVQNHPSIANGDVITTSPLAGDLTSLRDNQFVATKSGSKYRLGKKAPTAVAAAAVKKQPIREEVTAAQREKSTSKQRASDYNLNGKSIGDGKYLLSGQKLKSTSIRSEIYYAYKADKNGNPTGPRLTVKLSNNLESLSRENDTYNKVAGGLFYRDNFVRKVDFLPDAQGSRGFAKGYAALVLESGERTLRALCDARKNQGLEGKAMRQAAVALLQCIQAMQSYGMVWTDLKAENFVVVSNSLGEGSIEGIKAIDLESAVQAGNPPLDYSPEACPPEFAQAVSKGLGPEFEVNYEYDSWSYGMLLYELAVGKSYWAGKQDSAITRILKEPGFEVDVSAVQDDKLRDLISKCLQTNPRRRLQITQILFHPYFLTTGIGPISF